MVQTPADEIPVRAKYSVKQAPLSDDPNNFDHVGDVNDRVAEYVNVLKGEGIEVKRPSIFDFSMETKTPTWTAATQSGCTCPRDVFFISGNHLIEAPMSWKCRYFENLGYRDMMLDYWNKNPLMKWSAPPKPRLLDSSYQVNNPNKTIANNEILFDAADCRRFGKDIFVQDSHTANQMGIEWIRRTLASDGIRVHQFEFETATFSHIDAKITPISEDTMLWCAEERPSDSMFKLFKENEWNLLEMPKRQSCVSTG